MENNKNKKNLYIYKNKITRFFLQPYMLCIFGIICLSLVLNLLFLGDKSIWLDEAIGIEISVSDWSTLWDVILHGEANMVLYYILLHFWTNLGESEFVIRSLSVIFAVLAIPTVFALGARLFNKKVGLISALILSVNPFFIHYAQEARAYTMVLFLTVLSSLFFMRAMERPSKLSWGIYVISIVLAIYSQVFACLILAAHAISLMIFRKHRIPWKGTIISGITIIILILPLGFIILKTSSHNMDWAIRPTLESLNDTLAKLAGEHIILVLMFFIFIATCIYGYRQWVYYRDSYEYTNYVVLSIWFLAPIIILFCISQVKPMFEARYLTPCLPYLAILIGIGIFLLPKRWIIIASLALVLILSGNSIFYWYVEYEKEDWRNATGYILSKAEMDDVIIFYSPDTNTGYEYYKNKMFISDPPEVVPYFNPDNYPRLVPILNLPEGWAGGGVLPDPDINLPYRLSKYKTIWLVLSHENFSNLGRNIQSREIKNILQERFGVFRESKKFEGIQVYKFSS